MSSLERLLVRFLVALTAVQKRHSRRCRHRFAAKETGMRTAFEQHRNRFAGSHDSPGDSSALSLSPSLLLAELQSDSHEEHCTTMRGPYPELAPEAVPLLRLARIEEEQSKCQVMVSCRH